MYKLRPYQQDAVDATIKHFKNSFDPALIVLPTGSGKSLVIAELAKIAVGRVLVLAHVKELVEQNHQKYESYSLKAGIYSAGLNRKDTNDKVTFSSIQSLTKSTTFDYNGITLVVIDEAHRVSSEKETQYQHVITQLRQFNDELCLLGLTATPYRLGFGWIYQYHYQGEMRSSTSKFFYKCIYELTLKYLIKNEFLTEPIQIDSPVACYDFDSLFEKTQGRPITDKDLEDSLKDQKRITPSIMKNIIDLSEDRKGVMIFTSTVKHAKELLKYLPEGLTELVIGDTPLKQRDLIIQRFKKQEIKYLVNVSVLTTGFDAPHVDVIAILRPTQSLSLYQQIVGRGLRLSPGKENCLILDYTGLNYDIYSPLIHEKRPSEDSVIVDINCPKCDHLNHFWGIKDENDFIVEHFGQKCKKVFETPDGHEECGYLFRFKLCDFCHLENQISARKCTHCEKDLVDTDKKLKEAMSLKDAHVMKPETLWFEKDTDKNGEERLKITFFDIDVNGLSQYFYFNSKSSKILFHLTFVRFHLRRPELRVKFETLDQIIGNKQLFRLPKFIIARKKFKAWVIREKIFFKD